MFALTLHSHSMAHVAEEYLWLLTSTLAITAVVDICNTVALCYWLNKAKADAIAKR